MIPTYTVMGAAYISGMMAFTMPYAMSLYTMRIIRGF